MAKELIKPSNFAKVNPIDPDLLLENEALSKELAAIFDGKDGGFKAQQLVTGKVITNDADGVLVDIAYKSNGLIPRYEFSAHELKEIKPGSEIDVILDEVESGSGEIVLSYEKAKAHKAWQKITKLFEENKPVEGVITHVVKGGLSVDIGIPAFLPGSQVDLQRISDFNSLIGQTITAEIIKINKKRGNVIISRRKHLLDARSESRKKVLENLAEGSVIQGIVKNITNYGVFIDIGGVDGLLHITDMTWGRISHPSEIVKLGDNVTVKVITIDKDNAKISLGMKQLQDNPWAKLPKDITTGSKVTGKISSITDYGMFIEIMPGIEGLVHISEISWTNRVNDLKKQFSVGDGVEALVVSADGDNRRMSLSIKQLQNNPWKVVSDQFKVGDKIKGTISNITDFGVFIQILPGVDGLAHISDLSWTEHINHPQDLYKIGQDIEAIILAIEEDNKRVSLGVKQISPNPWDSLEKDYPLNSQVEVVVTKVASGNVFVKLPNGLEGMVSHQQTSADGKRFDELKADEKVTLRISEINKADRKLWLSLNLDETSTKTEKKKVVKKTTTKEAKPEAKTKSVLQLELEKHAAKKKVGK
jgi:small subunit ribosomal protein S1